MRVEFGDVLFFFFCVFIKRVLQQEVLLCFVEVKFIIGTLK